MDDADELGWDPALVERIARRLIAEPGDYFAEATAGADEPGPQALAEARARRLRDQLIALGVDGDRLMTHAREGRADEPRSVRVVNAEGVGPGLESTGAVIYIVHVDD